jgi:hypothetical protein
MNKLKHRPSSSLTRKLADWLRLSKPFELHTTFSEEQLLSVMQGLGKQFTGYDVTFRKQAQSNSFELLVKLKGVPVRDAREAHILGRIELVENMDIVRITGKLYPSIDLAFIFSFGCLVLLVMTIIHSLPEVFFPYITDNIHWTFYALIAVLDFFILVTMVEEWLQVFKDRRQILELLSNSVKSVEMETQETISQNAST